MKKHRINIAAALTLLAAACEPGTGGKPITFALALAAAPAAESSKPGHFATSTGWDVRLEEACIAVGPIYFFAGASHLQQAATAQVSQSWARRIANAWLPVAYAHTGDSHFNGGEVRGEWLNQAVIDALAPAPHDLGLHNGLAGAVASFSLRLDPPRGPLVSHPCLRGHHAWVSGVANKGNASVAFEGGLDIENIGTNRAVEGLALSTRFDNGTSVQILLRPSTWLDQAAFETLTTQAPSGRFLITSGSQVHRAWFIGARANGAFIGHASNSAL